jgi:hypothetical protein
MPIGGAMPENRFWQIYIRFLLHVFKWFGGMVCLFNLIIAGFVVYGYLAPSAEKYPVWAPFLCAFNFLIGIGIWTIASGFLRAKE